LERFFNFYSTPSSLTRPTGGTDPAGAALAVLQAVAPQEATKSAVINAPARATTTQDEHMRKIFELISHFTKE
jgi:hypothetical protein